MKRSFGVESFKLGRSITVASLGIFLILSFVLVSATAFAEGYPNKPIKIIVPYAPGGGLDTTARLMAPKMSEILGQPVIIENRAGAGGTIAAALVANAPADGYTILMVNVVAHAPAQGLYKLNYDPIKAFSAVGMAVETPYILVVNPSVPAKTVGELVALAKAKPGVINFGSNGIGGSTHLAGELLQSTMKVKMTHVPYKGGGPALVGVLSGQVQFVFDSYALLPHIKSGKLRALAVTSKKRMMVLPDLPTVAEQTKTDFEVVGQLGYVVPAATPRDIVNRLNAAINKTMASPDLIQQIRTQGGEPLTMSPAEFDNLIKQESVKWLKIIREAGIKPE